MSFADWWFGKVLGVERHAIDKMKLWGTGQDIGDPVFAGVDVSQSSALRLSVVYRCIGIISETLAGLPADIVRKVGEVRESVERQPAWVSQPNPETNWYEYAERVGESLLMDGNAFILITSRDALGFPRELWTLNPQDVVVEKKRGVIQFVWGGDTVLSRFGPDNAAGDVLHIKLRSGGGLRGLSPIGLARQALGLSMVTEKFGAEFFGRGQQMSGVIEMPAEVKSSKEHIELIRASWEQAHSGSDRAHRPAVITGGAKWQGITIPPEDAQFLETRKFQVEDIATRFYGVPAHMVGLEEKNTSWGSGIEAMTRGFFQTTMLPHFIRFETAHSGLLPRGQFLRLNQRALLRADSKTESDILLANLLNGVLNFDDVRAKYDIEPRPGGNRYMVPLNMQILEANGKPPAPAPVPEQLQPSPNGSSNGQGGTDEAVVD